MAVALLYLYSHDSSIVLESKGSDMFNSISREYPYPVCTLEELLVLDTQDNLLASNEVRFDCHSKIYTTQT